MLASAAHCRPTATASWSASSAKPGCGVFRALSRNVAHVTYKSAGPPPATSTVTAVPATPRRQARAMAKAKASVMTSTPKVTSPVRRTWLRAANW